MTKDTRAKTQPTKPSAGALRAAKEILDTDHQLAAQIIDRETGVGELLRTAKAVHDFLWKERGQIVGMTDTKLSEALTKAIREVEAALKIAP